ncbi:uncharacterized protein EAE97_002845 [Botrytis byssoidea]|uniref:Uncharacterized protein n=1 Tax=Botrytis byssoidea TaxID=139641 RepID=A0A9P5IRL3_9HELO|nr:uncharacterized protein EAE97_002845 [Botrytis byssoidea]KAF7949336.1 hypothetical protein EAE97_002845 [Botrytis byssoidea]
MEEQGQESLPRDATKEEIETLNHESDKIPFTAWLLAFTGAAAQLARFGITVAWQNYLQNPPGDEALPGALDLGESKATIIQNAFLFFQYLTPMPFALLSDAWLGRYKTMLFSLGLMVVGYTVLFVTALPSSLEHKAGLGGLIATMILTGLGQGGLSAVMYPFIGDQIPETNPTIKRNSKGKLVVTDRKLAIQYIFSGYYWMVNIAALSSIPTTFMEKYIGFWAAFLLPTCVLVVTIIPVIVWNERLVKLPPQGNILPQAGRVLLIATRSKFRLSAADPHYQIQHYNHSVTWNSSFIDEIRRGLKSCRVIISFVIFWLCYNQTANNLISQAGQMQSPGVSNDTIQSLNAIACIIMGPLIQYTLSYFQRRKIPLGPILRMTIGFSFIAAGIGYAAGLQQLIYSRGPCYHYPLECVAARNPQDSAQNINVQANNVSVWLQTPLQFLLAIGEILCLVSLSEYTYTEAPTNLKALVQAFQAVAAALGAAIGIGLGPVSRNPWLVIMFACLAGTMVITAVGFWVLFRGHDIDYAKADVVDAVESNENGGQRDDLEAVVCKKKTAGVDSHHGEKSISSNAVKAVEISL